MKRRMSGMSMVELTVVLAMIAIITAIAIPSITPLIRDNRVKSETRKVTDIMKVARMTALKDGLTTSVSIKTPKQMVITQERSGKTVTVKSSDIEYDAVYIGTNYQTISFGSDGILRGDYSSLPTLTISDGHNEYYVEIKRSGLARVEPMKELP